MMQRELQREVTRWVPTRPTYSPYSFDGRRLLAHELAHTIQQQSATAAAAAGPSRLTNASAEQASERTAEYVASDRPPQRMGTTPVRVQRKCACDESGGGNCECEEQDSSGTALPDSVSHKSPTIEHKLVVGETNDPLEQEADRVADQVVRVPNHHVSVAGDSSQPDRRGYGDAALQIVGETIRSPGRPLDAAARAQLEAGLGHDFSRVRVHADQKAADSARSVGAHAYTVGTNVVFGEGQYAPATTAGMKLLAHEMTHVVQQAASCSERSPGQVTTETAVIQRQPSPETRRPKQRPLDTAAQGIVAAASDGKVDKEKRAEKLVNDVLSTYFPGSASKITHVKYDDKKADKERLSSEPSPTTGKGPRQGVIYVGHKLLEEAIADPGGFAGVVASISHELEHVEQWRDPAIGFNPATKNQREFLAHGHEALFVEPEGTSKIHHSARAAHIDAALGAYYCLDAAIQQKADSLALKQKLLERRAHEIKFIEGPKKPPPDTCVPAP
jgi:hypothetical protein